MRKVFANIALVLSVALVSVFGVSSAAHASFSECPYPYACVFVDNNGQGSMLVLNLPGTWVCQGMPAGWNDVVSSAYNRFPSATLYLYTEGGCTGVAKRVDPGSTVNMWPINDTTSSYIFT